MVIKINVPYNYGVKPPRQGESMVFLASTEGIEQIAG